MFDQESGLTQGFRLQIELQDVHPPIWRLVGVPDDLTLGELHMVIQKAMGWEDSHLHQFIWKNQRVGNAQVDLEDEDMVDEEMIFLDEVFQRKGDTIIYEYDVGDGWHHKIICEGPLHTEDEPLAVIDGKRACPPEDCGGPPGYAHLLEAMADPKHPDHKELKARLGGRFNAENVDIKKVNHQLRQMYDQIYSEEDEEEVLSDDVIVYDALQAPDPEDWLDLDEGERVVMVQEYHEEMGFELPNPMLHAAIHTTVENQLAMGVHEVCKTLDRLMTEGLDRHDAIHAIGTVLATHIQQILSIGSGQKKQETLPAYLKDLEYLTAKRWIDDFGSEA